MNHPDVTLVIAFYLFIQSLNIDDTFRFQVVRYVLRMQRFF